MKEINKAVLEDNERVCGEEPDIDAYPNDKNQGFTFCLSRYLLSLREEQGS